MTKRKRYVLPALMLAASTLTSVVASAQVTLRSDVIGSGGTMATSGNLVLAGTLGQAIIGPTGVGNQIALQGFWYTMPEQGVSAVPEERTGTRASAVALHQNVPNPFSTMTDIQVDLPASGHVSLKIFDAIGHEVMTVVDDDRQAGSLTFHVSADALESGQYTARLVTGGVTRTIRMIVVR
jgi:hypothetical protein